MQFHRPKSSKSSGIDSSPNADLNELVDMAKEVGQADSYAGKRNNIRFKVGERLDICTDPGNPATLSVAVMHNISDDGAAFWMKIQKVPGDPLFVRQFLANGEATWTASEVRHCTRGIRGFLVGVTFIA